MLVFRVFSLFFVCVYCVDGIHGNVNVQVEEGQRLYSNYQVLRTRPTNKKQRNAIRQITKFVDLWSPLGPETSQVDILVEPNLLNYTKNQLTASGVTYQVMIEDLQKDIALENEVNIDYYSEDEPDRTSLFQLPGYSDPISNRRQGFSGLLQSFLRPRPRRPRVKHNHRPVESKLPVDAWQSGDIAVNRRPRQKLQVETSLPSSTSQPIISVPRSPCIQTGMNWRQYQSYETITAWLDCLAIQYPAIVTSIEIGKSSEGRPLRVLKIGKGSTNRTEIFIDGGIHAREWASPAAVTFIIHNLVEASGNFQHILDNLNIYVLTLANPDGYEYSRNHDRMWRKTRSKSVVTNLIGQVCHGVDPNRNFGYQWGGKGASKNPCVETYRGTQPFSEPETRAMRDFILGRRGNIKLYLTYHSYGQYILYPWGFDRRDLSDWRDLHRVGQVAADAMFKLTGAKYEIGSAAKMLYPAAGGSDDWARGGAGIKYSYTVELPDTGRHGFILPAKYIKKVGIEATAGVKALMEEVIRMQV